MNVLAKCNCGYNSESWASWSIWESGQSTIFNVEPWAEFWENGLFNNPSRSKSWSRDRFWSISQRDSDIGRMDF